MLRNNQLRETSYRVGIAAANFCDLAKALENRLQTELEQSKRKNEELQSQIASINRKKIEDGSQW